MKKLKPNLDEGMWKGAPPEGFAKAQVLRTRMTNAEIILWEKLRKNQIKGYKFRRQHPINIYIADFYCHKLNLIIEIDGKYHDNLEQVLKDEERTRILESNGLILIRFTNYEIENELEKVLQEILKKIELLEK